MRVGVAFVSDDRRRRDCDRKSKHGRWHEYLTELGRARIPGALCSAASVRDRAPGYKLEIGSIVANNEIAPTEAINVAHRPALKNAFRRGRIITVKGIVIVQERHPHADGTGGLRER